MKIGVFICHCGNNIGGVVDVDKVAHDALSLPHVVYAAAPMYTCADAGQKLIQQMIKEKGLTQVVVASCSPLVHENTFRRTVAKAGLNPFMFEMANIREHCSWIHEDKASATAKAFELVKIAVAKVAKNERLFPSQTEVTKKVMVIGAGITGIQAALDIADGGRDVVLVERKPSIGGIMSQMDKVFPTLDCSACILSPKMVDVYQNERIKLYSYTEVEEVSGYIGNFKVKLRRKARFVDEKTCTGCSECSKVCPIEMPNEFNEGMSRRAAIYVPFPQAVPKVSTIDKRGMAPCRSNCPLGAKAQGYVSLIAKGLFNEALRSIMQDNPFPGICGRVCQHPCEDNCKRGEFDEPLAIAALKRSAVDFATQIPALAKPLQTRPEKVAVIGAGPAGLTAAGELAKLGYQVNIFEASEVLGGMMKLGIPQYRLPRNILEKEIQAIIDLGVKINFKVRFGKDITVKSLFEDGYKAVFLAYGAQNSRKMEVPGEDLAGVYPALDFLKDVNLGKKVSIGNNVAVIGGGNTAIDAARCALRTGAKNVKILYRRTREEMPAAESEIDAAEAEGIKIQYLCAPVIVLGDEGKVTGVKCINMQLGEPDKSGRRSPTPIIGSEFVVEADTIMPAIGQMADLNPASGCGIKTGRAGVEIDKITMQTAIAGVFAGGDVSSGPATVTEAIRDGKAAAVSIDRYIRGESLTDGRVENLRRFNKEDIKIEYGITRKPRAETAEIPLHERLNSFKEVELGLSQQDAVNEARRCLACAGCGECGECVRVCEAKSINHKMKEEIIEVNVGAIVVTTGNALMDHTVFGEYGGGKFKDVVTGLQYERLLSASGPTGGHVVRISDHKKPKIVAFICCVGSRNESKGRPYCSAVCCMYVAKQAIITKEHEPDTQVFVFNMDVQIGGKNYAQFIRRAQEVYGIKYIRGKISKIIEKEGKLLLKGADTLLGVPVELEADMVVLAAGIDASRGSVDLAKKLNISHDTYGFFNESHPKLRPVESSTMGIFLAGSCQTPKDIPTSVAQASSVASKVLGLLSKTKLETSPLVAQVEARRCIGCFRCRQVCPFQAIEEQSMRDGSKIAYVNPAICHGCGVCNATCLPGAISLKGFTDDQILAEVEALKVED